MNDFLKVIVKDETVNNIYKKMSKSEQEKYLLDLYNEAYQNSKCSKCHGKTCLLNTNFVRTHFVKTPYGYETKSLPCKYYKEEPNLDLMFLEDMTGAFKQTKQRGEIAPLLLEAQKKNKGIFLCGDFGVGKTYLALQILKNYQKLGKTVFGTFYPDYIRFLGSQISIGKLEENVRKLKTVDVLFLDDLGAENNSGYFRDEILNPVLQYRMNNDLVTIITSNLNLEELEKHLALEKTTIDEMKAGRLIARIKAMMIVISLKGEGNFRRNK